jgi:prepilin-type N-terminal cleavage/methylation domain-containing protein
MKRRAGFTLIELLVTITVMVILLTLSVVGLASYQANARDEERKTDVQVIAQQLESYYESDHLAAHTLPRVSLADTHHNPSLAVAGLYTTGVYPTTDAMDTEAEIKTTLPALDLRALRDPATPTTSSVSLIVAVTASTPTLASLNSGKTYIYQPLDGSNTLCTSITQECRKFNLYYTLETDPTIKTITSKHQ